MIVLLVSILGLVGLGHISARSGGSWMIVVVVAHIVEKKSTVVMIEFGTGVEVMNTGCLGQG